MNLVFASDGCSDGTCNPNSVRPPTTPNPTSGRGGGAGGTPRGGTPPPGTSSGTPGSSDSTSIPPGGPGTTIDPNQPPGTGPGGSPPGGPGPGGGSGDGGEGGGGGNGGDGGGGGDGGDGGGFGGLSLMNIVQKAGLGAAMFGTIGALAGGDDGALWGSVSGAIGGVVAGVLEPMIGEIEATIVGLVVATIIFLLTWKKKVQEVVEFYCLPWQAPIGGEDCELCNNLKECSEYTCRSLGQACELVNVGTTDQKCIWKNPKDVNSPIIKMESVSKGHKFKPDPSVRPPSTGVVITKDDGKCIKAFTPLEFKFTTDEPAQCKIDYNLTTGYKEMNYYVGGSNLFSYNHTEKLSLPGPSAINAVAPELKNNGEYILFIRCQDANGNFNQDPYSVSFCVEKGPDTTPPKIEGVSIPSERPVQFNQSTLYLEVYVNEPSECKWSREDRAYDNMETKMSCDTNLWEMNWNGVYTCRTNLTGLESRKENKYYFRCKDQPWAEEGDRNVNTQSYLYKVIGTQPLNILRTEPSGKIIGATDTIPVFLEIETDNGYKNGESLCYYHQSRPEKEEDYILFSDTGGNKHKQRQDLIPGNYEYYFKCVDLGGNTVYNKTSFIVESDRTEPYIVRVYKESGELKIITNEVSECSYSTKDCNFEIESGIKMDSLNNFVHSAEWKINQNYYIRCRDLYNNQPYPNVCSGIVRPSKLNVEKEVVNL